MASKCHNLSNEALADEIGRVDAIAKAAEAELTALKDEFKARGLKQAIGERTEVTAAESISRRCGLSLARQSRDTRRRLFRP
jgi:hypothetical protein